MKHNQDTWGRILADSTLNRLVNRLNRKFPWMGEADLVYIVTEFEKANGIQLRREKV